MSETQEDVNGDGLSSLLEVLKYDDLTKGFAECLHNGVTFEYNRHLKNHDEFDFDMPQPLWPCCTLVYVEEEIKSDGKLKGAHLYHMILFEEEHLFYAVTNSNLHNKYFQAGPPSVGSSITLSQHSVIHGAYYTHQPMLCVLIHDLIYRKATTIQEIDRAHNVESQSMANIIIPDDVSRIWFHADFATVRSVKARGGICLLSALMDPCSGHYYLTGAKHPRIGSPPSNVQQVDSEEALPMLF